jgi:hypothetical protein
VRPVASESVDARTAQMIAAGHIRVHPMEVVDGADELPLAVSLHPKSVHQGLVHLPPDRSRTERGPAKPLTARKPWTSQRCG